MNHLLASFSRDIKIRAFVAEVRHGTLESKVMYIVLYICQGWLVVWKRNFICLFMYVFTFQKMVVLCRLPEIVIFAIRSEQIVIIPKGHLEQNL